MVFEHLTELTRISEVVTRGVEKGLGLVFEVPHQEMSTGSDLYDIWPEDQSTNGLYCLSQFKPRTAEQGESNEVM